MLIDQYFKQISTAFAHSPLLQQADLEYDRRDKSTGFIRGNVTFIDGSILHIREFVNVMDSVHRLMYSYQYMNASKELVFRYDDTDHHRRLGLPNHPHHKHDGSEENITASSAPTLAEVLDEISLLLRLD